MEAQSIIKRVLQTRLQSNSNEVDNFECDFSLLSRQKNRSSTLYVIYSAVFLGMLLIGIATEAPQIITIQYDKNLEGTLKVISEFAITFIGIVNFLYLASSYKWAPYIGILSFAGAVLFAEFLLEAPFYFVFPLCTVVTHATLTSPLLFAKSCSLTILVTVTYFLSGLLHLKFLDYFSDQWRTIAVIISVSLLAVPGILAWRRFMESIETFFYRQKRVHESISHDLYREKALNDELVASHIPNEMVSARREGAKDVARQTRASILVVHLNGISKAPKPSLAVTHMSNVFSLFDEIVEQTHVEKVKTVGSCYMVAAGITEIFGRRNQALDALDLALVAFQMAHAAKSYQSQIFKDGSKLDLSMTAALHSGLVVTAVSGGNVLHYDIWGSVVRDTFLLSRLPGLPGRLLVTEHSKKLLIQAMKTRSEKGISSSQEIAFTPTEDMPIAQSDRNSIQDLVLVTAHTDTLFIATHIPSSTTQETPMLGGLRSEDTIRATTNRYVRSKSFHLGPSPKTIFSASQDSGSVSNRRRRTRRSRITPRSSFRSNSPHPPLPFNYRHTASANTSPATSFFLPEHARLEIENLNSVVSSTSSSNMESATEHKSPLSIKSNSASNVYSVSPSPPRQHYGDTSDSNSISSSGTSEIGTSPFHASSSPSPSPFASPMPSPSHIRAPSPTLKCPNIVSDPRTPIAAQLPIPSAEIANKLPPRDPVPEFESSSSSYAEGMSLSDMSPMPRNSCGSEADIESLADTSDTEYQNTSPNNSSKGTYLTPFTHKPSRPSALGRASFFPVESRDCSSTSSGESIGIMYHNTDGSLGDLSDDDEDIIRTIITPRASSFAGKGETLFSRSPHRVNSPLSVNTRSHSTNRLVKGRQNKKEAKKSALSRFGKYCKEHMIPIKRPFDWMTESPTAGTRNERSGSVSTVSSGNPSSSRKFTLEMTGSPIDRKLSSNSQRTRSLSLFYNSPPRHSLDATTSSSSVSPHEQQHQQQQHGQGVGSKFKGLIHAVSSVFSASSHSLDRSQSNFGINASSTHSAEDDICSSDSSSVVENSLFAMTDSDSVSSLKKRNKRRASSSVSNLTAGGGRVSTKSSPTMGPQIGTPLPSQPLPRERRLSSPQLLDSRRWSNQFGLSNVGDAESVHSIRSNVSFDLLHHPPESPSSMNSENCAIILREWNRHVQLGDRTTSLRLPNPDDDSSFNRFFCDTCYRRRFTQSVFLYFMVIYSIAQVFTVIQETNAFDISLPQSEIHAAFAILLTGITALALSTRPVRYRLNLTRLAVFLVGVLVALFLSNTVVEMYNLIQHDTILVDGQLYFNMALFMFIMVFIPLRFSSMIVLGALLMLFHVTALVMVFMANCSSNEDNPSCSLTRFLAHNLTALACFGMGCYTKYWVEWLSIRIFYAKGLVHDSSQKLKAAQDDTSSTLVSMFPRWVTRALDPYLEHDEYIGFARDLLFSGNTIVRAFKSASVVWAQIVGLESLQSLISASDLFLLLSRVFSDFDELCDEFGADRGQSFGESYLAVFVQEDSELLNGLRLCAAMRRKIEEFNSTYGLGLAVSFGVSHGELLAGMIGKTHSNFDVWGGVVNLAQHLVSKGEPGSLYVSSVTNPDEWQPVYHPDMDDPDIAHSLFAHAFNPEDDDENDSGSDLETDLHRSFSQSASSFNGDSLSAISDVSETSIKQESRQSSMRKLVQRDRASTRSPFSSLQGDESGSIGIDEDEVEIDMTLSMTQPIHESSITTGLESPSPGINPVLVAKSLWKPPTSANSDESNNSNNLSPSTLQLPFLQSPPARRRSLFKLDSGDNRVRSQIALPITPAPREPPIINKRLTFARNRSLSQPFMKGVLGPVMGLGRKEPRLRRANSEDESGIGFMHTCSPEDLHAQLNIKRPPVHSITSFAELCPVLGRLRDTSLSNGGKHESRSAWKHDGPHSVSRSPSSSDLMPETSPVANALDEDLSNPSESLFKRQIIKHPLFIRPMIAFSLNLDAASGSNVRGKGKRALQISDLERIATLGRGAFAEVFLASDRLTGKLFAVKMLDKTRNMRSVRVELKILAHAQHRHVVHFEYSLQTKRRVYLVMEYLQGYTLGDLINNYCLDEILVRVYMAELVLAFEYVHDLGIVHRDVKPENIMINADGHVKLMDFGLSTIVAGHDRPSWSSGPFGSLALFRSLIPSTGEPNSPKEPEAGIPSDFEGVTPKRTSSANSRSNSKTAPSINKQEMERTFSVDAKTPPRAPSTKNGDLSSGKRKAKKLSKTSPQSQSAFMLGDRRRNKRRSSSVHSEPKSEFESRSKIRRNSTDLVDFKKSGISNDDDELPKPNSQDSPIIEPHKPSFVVIDSSRHSRTFSCHVLRACHIDVMTARDSHSALKLIRRNVDTIDLVLFDMNIHNGFNLLRSLKSSETLRRIPIILTTSDKTYNHATLQKWLSVGPKDYVSKPLRSDIIAFLLQTSRWSDVSIPAGGMKPKFLHDHPLSFSPNRKARSSSSPTFPRPKSPAPLSQLGQGSSTPTSGRVSPSVENSALSRLASSTIDDATEYSGPEDSQYDGGMSDYSIVNTNNLSQLESSAIATDSNSITPTSTTTNDNNNNNNNNNNNAMKDHNVDLEDVKLNECDEEIMENNSNNTNKNDTTTNNINDINNDNGDDTVPNENSAPQLRSKRSFSCTGDFSSPSPVTQPRIVRQQSATFISSAHHTTLKAGSDGKGSLCRVGTAPYMAPELVKREVASGQETAVDWWALGVVFFEALCGFRPFDGETTEEVFDRILNHDINWDIIPETVSEEAIELIRELLMPEPSQRLGSRGIEEVKNHKYFNDIDWTALSDREPFFRPEPPQIPTGDSNGTHVSDLSNFSSK